MPTTRSGRRRGPGRAPRGAPPSKGQTTTHAGRPGGQGQHDAAAARPGSGAAASRLPGAAPAWVPYTTLVLSVLGLGVSVYLTVEHFLNGSSLACPETGVINCAKVTNSPQSEIFGIPLPILGLVFFAWMIVINSPPAWRSPRPEVRLVRLVSVIVGIATVIYLIYAELFLVGNICLECTSIHVITFALFVITLFTATGSGRATPRRP